MPSLKQCLRKAPLVKHEIVRQDFNRPSNAIALNTAPSCELRHRMFRSVHRYFIGTGLEIDGLARKLHPEK